MKKQSSQRSILNFFRKENEPLSTISTVDNQVKDILSPIEFETIIDDNLARLNDVDRSISNSNIIDRTGAPSKIYIEEVIVDSSAKKSSSDAFQISKLSDYELTRLDNMRRNAEFLASLGLDMVKPIIFDQGSAKAKHVKGSKKRTFPALEESDRPIRRSLRVINSSSKVSYSESIEEQYTEDHVNEETADCEVECEDSAVYHYILSEETKGDDSSATTNNKLNKSIHKIRDENPEVFLKLKSEKPIFSEDLAVIYSMEFNSNYKNILVAAGKGGYVTLFNLKNSDISKEETNNINNFQNSEHTKDSSTLISFKAHDRWVSAAKFCGPNYFSASCFPVITTSDDGMLKIWDLNKASCNVKVGSSTVLPKLLLSTNKLHDRGIYTMDEKNGLIITGSKDRTICLSKIENSSIVVDSVYDIHSRVVKSVSWMHSDTVSANVFISGGQDRRVALKDIRSNNLSSPDLYINDAHNGAVHTVAFNRFSCGNENSNIFLTAGLDPVIKIFDMRMLSSNGDANSLFEFFGHHSSSVKKLSEIIAPKFLTPDIIITAGEGNQNISLYSLKSGKAISRGMLPDSPITYAISLDGNIFGSTSESCVDDIRIAIACKRGGGVYSATLSYA
jgi:hypothetical protein